MANKHFKNGQPQNNQGNANKNSKISHPSDCQNL